MKFLKAGIAVLSCLSLSACLEVEDSSNDELVRTLQAQNEILAQEQEANTVAITGLIVNAKNNEAVTSASVTVKKGSDVLFENTDISSGIFVFEGLPPDSDLEIIITSPLDEFMQRVFYINTGNSTSGEAFKDLGAFSVSEALNLEITALSSLDNIALSGLQFEASSVFGDGASALSYKHVSSFDESTGVYTISIPKYLTVLLAANLDLDLDGNIDLIPEDYSYSSSNSFLYVSNANTLDNFTIYFFEPDSVVVGTEVEYRVSVVNEAGIPIENAQVVIDDDNNDNLQATYDETSEQYVLNARFDDYIDIEIPSFTVDGISYESASISVYTNSENGLRISTSGSFSNSFYEVPETDVLELAIGLREVTFTDLEVVLASDPASADDSSYSVFYSQAVNVPEASVSLYNQDAITVIKGNDDPNDLILPGTTLVVGGEYVPLTSSMSLNNTKLTLTPTESLTPESDYTYDVSSIEVVSSQLLEDVYGDSVSFTTPADLSAAFDINEVRLDNENYTSNGNVITPENTAGENSSPSNFYIRGVYWYFPASIENLQHFTIRKFSVVEDGVASIDVDTYNIVEDGSIYGSQVSLLALAENEVFESDNVYRTVIRSAALPDSDKIYRFFTNEYMADNLEDSENSISFEYAYETLGGEVVTGQLTLPVN